MGNYSTHIKRFFKTMLFFGFVGLFVFIISAAAIERGKVICTDVVVNIAKKDKMQFLDDADVTKLITDNGQKVIINQPLAAIDLAAMEAALEKHAFIKNAEVHSNFEGVIEAKIQQKEPLYRVFNNNGVSYYISQSGTKMPLSPKFTPRLIVATGYVPDVANIEDDEVNKDLKTLIDFILEDEFWTAMIGEINVKANHEFVLYPKLDGLKVELGSVDNLSEKFRNLKIFYIEALPHTNWQSYESINLKYNGQIVCSKK